MGKVKNTLLVPTERKPGVKPRDYIFKPPDIHATDECVARSGNWIDLKRKMGADMVCWHLRRITVQTTV